MLKKIRQKLLGYSKVAGVEIVLLPDGKYTLNLTVLTLKNNHIFSEAKESGLESWEKLSKFLTADIPLAISITGKGIIHKKADLLNSENEMDYLQQVFPNAKASEFFVQVCNTDKASFVSIVRKEVLEQILSEIKQTGMFVVKASLGPFSIVNHLDLIDHEGNSLNFSGHSLILENNKPVDYKTGDYYSGMDFKLAEEKVPEQCLISFASAFNLLYPVGNFGGLTESVIQEGKEEFQNRKIFRIGGFSFMVFMFIVLLVNYLLFASFKTENERLSAENGIYSGMLDEVKELETKVNEKEYFLKSAGWLTIPKTSYYADQIAAEVPASIKLTELSINPVNDKISKAGKKLIFRSDTILIAGTCINPTVLNPWMEKMKGMPWVRSVKNVGYNHDAKNKVGNFKLELIVGDE